MTLFKNLTLVTLLALCTACGTKTEIGTKLKGDRLPVLTFEQSIEVDPALRDVPITLPPPYTNADWPQSGGSPGKSMVHVIVDESLSKLWEQSIGDGDSRQRKLLATPVVAGGKLFAIDTKSQITALDAMTGRLLWRRPIKVAKRSGNVAFGGGVAVGDGTVFATTGYGVTVALDPATGAEKWRHDLDIPLRGAPAFANGKVYVVTQDNQLVALSADKGTQLWDAVAIVENAGLLGAAPPAIADDTLVIGYSSGELNAIKTDTGQVTWQDNLARTARLTALASLTDIDASPVIDRGRVFAIGHGGRMVALDLATGERVWERSLGGVSTPWVAGDFLFTVTTDGEVVALTRRDGRIRWVTQLQRYEDVAGRKGRVAWQGPILASDRLLLTSSNGDVASLSPYTGELLASTKMGDGSWLPPIIANGVMYVLTSAGKVIAYK
jgi:outer membrane protein assembly factor BamB